MNRPHSDEANPLFGPSPGKLNRWQVRSPRDAAFFLAKKARNAAKASGNPHVLTVGRATTFNRWIREDLERRGFTAGRMTLAELAAGDSPPGSGCAIVVCTETDIRRTTEAARAVMRHPELLGLPFEAVTLTAGDYEVLERYDRVRATGLVSPVPILEPAFAEIYEASMALFEPKCDVRDYLDLCQAVSQVIDNGIEGDVAEFGSFQGHSGWLLARLMDRRSSDRRLFLFDMFDAFPTENLGIDRFWSGSHPVDFGRVRERFRPFPFVTLVRGDFTHTFDRSGLQRLCLVHVDCDSYRGTSYLVQRLFPEILSRGGIMVFEDYGHPQLIGSRAAVHDYFDGRTDAVRFFSHFSGCYLVVKR